jgi:hypothetical protein
VDLESFAALPVRSVGLGVPDSSGIGLRLLGNTLDILSEALPRVYVVLKRNSR